MNEELTSYEWLDQEFDRLAVLRKMWTANEVAAMIRRHDIERGRPSPTVEPVAWEAYWPGAGSINSQTAMTNRRAKALEWERDGAEVTPLYYAATISALEAERDEARNQRDYYRGRDQAGAEIETELIAALATANARIAMLEKALAEIARQKKTEELDTEYDVEMSSFEDGYDLCIDRARAALEPTHDN